VARKHLNLGILAHVDAGKTTLTERLLYAARVIDEVGSVDAGTTQTDSLELERERGITIKSAVVSFAIDDITVNLVDTPGHPDFIAEVERVLSVLDGAVLVISAVEGVQTQTRILMRALQRLRVPTLLFVNKIDRPGADDARVLQAIAERLTPAAIPMGAARNLGTRGARFVEWNADDATCRAALAEALAERDEALLASYVDDEAGLSSNRLRRELAAQTERALVHPVFLGSARTGAGVAKLMAGIAELLPAGEGDADAPVSGTVFKIERRSSGEKIAFVRLFSGTVKTRDRLRVGRDLEEKVTAIRVFEAGAAVQRGALLGGEIGQLWGLAGVQIGDRIGEAGTTWARHQFAPPTLEAAVTPRDGEDRRALHTALVELAEQDPLINLRQDDSRDELAVSLYGDVQKEVIEATLAQQYGVEATFRDTTTIYVERPIGTGNALELLRAKTKTNVTGKCSPNSSNPFPATLGLRIEPSPLGSGIGLRLDIDVRLVPLYIYKRVEVFVDHMTSYVREALQEGLFGWQVIDCEVTLTDCGYRAPGTTASDFRRLTPIVVMQALDQAGTVVCEPMELVTLEIPVDKIAAIAAALARVGGRLETQSPRGALTIVETRLASWQVRELRRQLPGLTGGEGVLEATFAGYEPVDGEPPTRRRTTPNPLNREEYLMRLARRVSGG
jgi:ribosomal protection tetracycline resistance protein